MEAAAPTFILVAAVVEVVCVSKECSRAGDGEVAVHVEVDAENHSVLGRIVARISRFDFVLDCDVEVVRPVTLVERCFLAFPVVRPILRKRRAVLLVRCDELGGHAVIHGGECHVVVVIGDGATVVYDN